MKSKGKIELLLNHFQKELYNTKNILLNSFQNKEQKSAKFFKDNYLHYNSNFLFSRLEEYWNMYRYFAEIKKIIDANKASFNKSKILDIGCGYTSVLNILPESEKYGIDIVIDDLKRDGFPLSEDIKWINGSGEKMSFKDDFFDIVICSNGIDHHDNPLKTLSEIKRVLKNQGFLILTLDVFDKNIGYRDKQHPHSYTDKKILSELSEFNILFKKKSLIKAQFCRFMEDKVKIMEDRRELILVARLSKNEQLH